MSTNETEDNRPAARIIGTAELAQRIGRTPRYVQQLAAEKIIPSIKLPGRDRLFDWEKVLTALSRFEEKRLEHALDLATWKRKTRLAGRVLKTDDTGTLSNSQSTCKKTFPDWPREVTTPKRLESDCKMNGESLAPEGYGHFYNAEGHRHLEPLASAPDEGVSESERVAYARVILGMSEWVHQPKLSMRWAAAFIALGTLKQSPKELAASFGVKLRRAQQLIKEANEVLAELQRETKR